MSLKRQDKNPYDLIAMFDGYKQEFFLKYLILCLFFITKTSLGEDVDNLNDGIQQYLDANDKQAINILSRVDGIKSKTILGFIYFDENSKYYDQDKAFLMFSDAAALGGTDAEVQLGLIYRVGIDNIPIDFDKSKDLLVKAADKDHPVAMMFLGEGCLLSKVYNCPEIKAPLYLIGRAEKAGVLEATTYRITYRLANLLEYRYQRTTYLALKSMAESGVSYAQGLFAEFYATDRPILKIVKKDDVEALKWVALADFQFKVNSSDRAMELSGRIGKEKAKQAITLAEDWLEQYLIDSKEKNRIYTSFCLGKAPDPKVCIRSAWQDHTECSYSLYISFIEGYDQSVRYDKCRMNVMGSQKGSKTNTN